MSGALPGHVRPALVWAVALALSGPSGERRPAVDQPLKQLHALLLADSPLSLDALDTARAAMAGTVMVLEILPSRPDWRLADLDLWGLPIPALEQAKAAARWCELQATLLPGEHARLESVAELGPSPVDAGTDAPLIERGLQHLDRAEHVWLTELSLSERRTDGCLR